MQQCHSCQGFVPPKSLQCPHCDINLMPASKGFLASFKQQSLTNKILAAATPAAFMFTLMACYGGGPVRNSTVPGTPGGVNTQDHCQTEDYDRDGYFSCIKSQQGLGMINPKAKKDCNDENSTINPGAKDPLGDGIDQNCDGKDG